ncbi:MAG TPA: FtsX-like permease family protein [Terriglobales bacterium]|jgi:putative ABC transport system permease protein
MTLISFVRKNSFRNKRRSILTMLSIGFSLLLLTFMMTVWRGFFIDSGTADSALRLMTRHKVSLAFTMPAFYRQKIRAVHGVAAVVPLNWFGGVYKDDKSGNFFAQFGTDPDEFFDVYKDFKIDPDQLAAWKRDRAGAIVDENLAKKYGWKVGQRVVIVGQIFPVNLELNIRGIFSAPQNTQSLYFNEKYVEEAVSYMKDQHGMYAILADNPGDVSSISSTIDGMFRNSPQPTKTEDEKGFQRGFIAMLGNVKAFLLSISLAVVFTILLVSANTMAMSIRERTREVAVLKTLGFTRRSILGLFIGEAVTLALVGGIFGSVLAFLLGHGASTAMGGFGDALKVKLGTMVFAWAVAALVGFLSAAVPAYYASRIGIVEGLRHIG